jgi:hypothetical protein
MHVKIQKPMPTNIKAPYYRDACAYVSTTSYLICEYRVGQNNDAFKRMNGLN